MEQVEVEPGRVLVAPEVGFVYRNGKNVLVFCGWTFVFQRGAKEKMKQKVVSAGGL